VSRGPRIPWPSPVVRSVVADAIGEALDVAVSHPSPVARAVAVRVGLTMATKFPTPRPAKIKRLIAGLERAHAALPPTIRERVAPRPADGPR
jgi:hypothetical protein